jgi:hypothetical protein
MAEALGICLYCKKEFEDKRDKYTHLERWGCKQMYEDLTIFAAPLCACGCGRKVEVSKRDPSKFNLYVKGHNKRPKEK